MEMEKSALNRYGYEAPVSVLFTLELPEFGAQTGETEPCEKAAEHVEHFAMEAAGHNRSLILRRNCPNQHGLLAEQEWEPVREPAVRVGAKIGRNDPCPCGSGKNTRSVV